MVTSSSGRADRSIEDCKFNFRSILALGVQPAGMRLECSIDSGCRLSSGLGGVKPAPGKRFPLIIRGKVRRTPDTKVPHPFASLRHLT
jgi:hypothetical protein